MTLALFTPLPSQAKSNASPPAHKAEITEAWVAYDHLNINFYRLRLDPDGTGHLSVARARHQPKVYKIKRWSIEKGSLKLTFTEQHKKSPQVQCISTSAHNLHLEILHWYDTQPRKVKLIKEEALKSIMVRAEAAMHKHIEN